MSTRELAYEIIDSMNKEQLERFVAFFSTMFYEVPNEETMAAMEEADKMLQDPNARKFHSVEELFEELDA